MDQQNQWNEKQNTNMPPYGGSGQGAPYGKSGQGQPPYGSGHQGTPYGSPGQGGHQGAPYGNPGQGGHQGAPYGNPQQGMPYGVPPQPKRDGQVYGVVSLVLGFLALLFFCACINVPLAMLSVFFGMVQIIGYKDKLLAGFGIALSTMSLILMIIAIVVFTSIHIDLGPLSPNGTDSGADSYEEYFERYFNNLEDLEDGSF